MRAAPRSARRLRVHRGRGGARTPRSGPRAVSARPRCRREPTGDGDGDGEISAPGAAVRTFVVTAREDLEIASRGPPRRPGDAGKMPPMPDDDSPRSCSSTAPGTAAGAGTRCGNGSHADGVATAAVDNPVGDAARLRSRAPTATTCAPRSTRSAARSSLVGHSYGGAVITDAGAHPNVERLVYLTAFPLDAGESVAQNALVGGEEMKLGEVDAIRRRRPVSVDPARSTEFFFHDCPADVAAAAVARLRPMSMAAMTGVTAVRRVAREARRPTSCAPTTGRYPSRCNARPRRAPATSSRCRRVTRRS